MLRSTFALVALALTAAACSRGPDADDARRADPAAAQQLALTEQLSAQKDSLTAVVLETDRFLAAIDSQLQRAPGGKRKPAPQAAGESPVTDQLRQREELLARVQALVDRTRETSRQLTQLRSQNAQLRTELAQRIAASDSLVAELGGTIQRQLETIQSYQLRVDSLSGVARALEADTTTLRTEIRGMTDAQARAWVAIGTEAELLAKGVVVREGGANLLVARVGRTLQPARTLPESAFVRLDVRRANEIALPDSTRRYEIVSRHPLAAVDSASRDGAGVRRVLRIADPAQFWAASRWLILVQR